MKKIYESYFYDFALAEESNALVFQWKPETAAIQDRDFQEALSNYGGYAFELEVSNMVVDVRNFRPPAGTPSQEAMGAWRARVVVPRYNQAGVKKFAYLVTAGAPGPQVGGPIRHEGEEFETAVFDSEADMNTWLIGSS